ncbi:MAG TPA: hypothetical protein VJU84_21620 [Pyrinomonadaceae bacterium]|nr:hypothetical protein [Pyrinomonadaceae bacterium]
MEKPFALLLLLFGFLAGNPLPQTKAASQNKNNLYAIALSACVKKEFEEYGYMESSGRTFYNRIVEYDRLLTKNLPTQFGDFKIEYLNEEDLSERYKKTRKKLSVLRIFPMENDGAILKIDLPHLYVSVPKRRHYVYEMEGGCQTEFKYDSSQENFILSKVKLWGV